jgi:hypothetical protein
VEWGGWISKEIRRPHGCSLWKGILFGWDFFKQHVELVAGMGDRIWFWHYHWCGSVPLKTLFLVLFLVLPQGMLPLLLACLVLMGIELGI